MLKLGQSGPTLLSFLPLTLTFVVFFFSEVGGEGGGGNHGIGNPSLEIIIPNYVNLMKIGTK